MSRAPQDQSDDHRGPSPLGSREEHSFCNAGHPFRSEEHTSELQSHSDLVCRLLLEKKKQKGQHLWNWYPRVSISVALRHGKAWFWVALSIQRDFAMMIELPIVQIIDVICVVNNLRG